MRKVLRKFCFFADFFGFLGKVFPNVLYYKKKCDIITMANCPLAFVKGSGEHPRGLCGENADSGAVSKGYGKVF